MTVHAAIPTVYRGIQMRSRLEAKWACVFDQLGWTWEYEPFDLNGWIPDFILLKAPGIERCYYSDPTGKPILAEVKPLSTVEDLPVELRDKIEGAMGAPATRSRNGRVAPFTEWETHFDTRPYDAMVIGLNPEAVWLQCRGPGWLNGSNFFDEPYYGGFVPEPWQPVWAQAHNQTQWKAPR